MTPPHSSEPPFGVLPSGLRLPALAHVGGVQLQVSNVRRSIEYYELLLGLTAETRPDGTVALAAKGQEAPLVTLHTRPGVTRARRGALGLYHFAILLPDRAALGRFAGHLARLRVEVGMADHLVSEALYLWDPDGLGIEVYADRPRETWQHRGRELVMTTDPLDVDNLIDAAGGEDWTGMPPGTTMGHVHLHVGSLDGAEAFYHRALGFDKTVWSYPGALFMSAGGYHHQGTNVWAQGPSPSPEHAQLLEWELIVPSSPDLAGAADSLQAAGYAAERARDSVLTADPWGTRVRLRSNRSP
jgi:catechol 2,3-dioxygenase